MGFEAECRATWGRKASSGKARLEEKELRFRGEGFSLRIPLAEVKRVQARDGGLELEWAAGRAVFALGAGAEKWAAKIQNPRSRLDKLGVKPGAKAAVLGLADAAFLAELRERGAAVSVGRVPSAADVVFLAASQSADLARLRSLRDSIQRAGAIWVLWAKGRKAAIGENDVRAAALAGGLVDVKVMSFSETLSGLKLVIPLSRR
jgi:hypothetical protein